jgi:hypothetical protein
MAIDYWQVLKEMRDEEVRLESELKTIRSTLPGVELLAKRNPPPPPVWTVPVAPLSVYMFMGTKQAITHYLGAQTSPKMPADIAKALLEGGIVTKSSDFAGMVATTLTQMKADYLVERLEDGWQLKQV